MAAIWGIIDLSGSLSVQELSKLGSRMRERYEESCSLDHIQERVCDCAYMGCGVQYITQHSDKEKLPVHENHSNTMFNADCLLDNRDEIMKDLQIGSEDTPDGELMYQSYRRLGIDCISRFRGLFSVAVYEQHNQMAYLAADQLAGRCLYYYRRGDVLVYSTLIEPIRRCFSDIKVNTFYIKDYLTAPGMLPNISSTETSYEGIYKLNPGTYMRFTKEDNKEVQYWSPFITRPDYHCKNAKEYGNYFRKLYEKCVQDALRTCGKVGIAMSSGLDSASAGVLAADELRKTGQELYAYTYVPFETEIQSRRRNHVTDEQRDVEQIIQLHPNIIPHFLNNGGRNCLEKLNDYIELAEMPIKAIVNFPSLCEIYEHAGKDGCKVVLTGQFGNSTVSHGYIDDVWYDLYKRKRYVKILADMNRYCPKVGEGRKAALKDCYKYFRHADRSLNKNRFEYKPDNPFLSESVCEEYPLEKRFTEGGVTQFESIPVDRQQYRRYLWKLAVYTYLGEIETKLGLRYHMVLRDPTRDMRMLEFCYWLPYELYAYRGIPRWLIRGNMQDVLPGKLLDNWMRYGVQNADWYLRIVRDWEQVSNQIRHIVQSEQAKKCEYFNYNEIYHYLDTMPVKDKKQPENKFRYLFYICAVEHFITIQSHENNKIS